MAGSDGGRAPWNLTLWAGYVHSHLIGFYGPPGLDSAAIAAIHKPSGESCIGHT
jgi:hypothetical protein